MRGKSVSLAMNWRTILRRTLVALWGAICVSQIVLYTSLLEIIGYGLLDVAAIFLFLKLVPVIENSTYGRWALMLSMSFVLGLVPYKIKINHLMLFLFDSAKSPNVTYFSDPYMNPVDLFFILLFPATHFLLMYAISKTYPDRWPQHLID